MHGFTIVLGWYVVILAAGVIGFRALRRLGLGDSEAWAGGRIFGLAFAVPIPWWLGWAGVESWQSAAGSIFALAAVAAIIDSFRHRPHWRELVLPECVFLVGFAAVLLVRLDRPEILFTEKFMDLGVLNAVLQTSGFPPPDLWLGGETLPYYYWGALLWIVPLWFLATDIGLAYNILVAGVGGLIAALAWSLGFSLSASKRGGLLAALLCTAAGTLDGLRQLAASRSLSAVDIWQSSRQDASVITEFPLFTLWLGDLHPHLLSIPLVLLAVMLALHFCRHRITLWRLLLVAGVLGLVAAANPWSYPPTLAAVLLLLWFGEQYFKPGRPRWMGVLAMPPILIVGAWLTALPFLLGYDAPFRGLGRVFHGTSVPALLNYAGVLLVPTVGYALTRLRAPPLHRETGYVVTVTLAALTFSAAAVSGRPALVLLGALLLSLIYACYREPAGPGRSAVVLAGVGVLLLLVPELVFVQDDYNEQFYRMNTVFKSYIQSWIFLSLALPVLLVKWMPRAWPRRAFVSLLVVIAAIHPAGLIARFDPGNVGLDGLSWMAPEDRAVVAYLAALEDDVVILETVGDAYSDSARISVAAGVPAYLGWANHELVWRGRSIGPELARREAIAKRLYAESDPIAIANLARQENIDLIVIGSLEKNHHSSIALSAIERAGTIVFKHGSARVVRIP